MLAVPSQDSVGFWGKRLISAGKWRRGALSLPEIRIVCFASRYELGVDLWKRLGGFCPLGHALHDRMNAIAHQPEAIFRGTRLEASLDARCPYLHAGRIFLRFGQATAYNQSSCCQIKCAIYRKWRKITRPFAAISHVGVPKQRLILDATSGTCGRCDVVAAMDGFYGPLVAKMCRRVTECSQTVACVPTGII